MKTLYESLVDNEISGVYRALVVDDKDSTFRGRVKIRIPALHGIPGDSSFVPDSDLPWALPMTMNGLGVNSGQMIIPKPGMIVFVMFEADNIRDPLYLGTVPLSRNAYSIGSIPSGSIALLKDLYKDGIPNLDILYRGTDVSIAVDRENGILLFSPSTVISDGTIFFRISDIPVTPITREMIDDLF